MKTRKPCRNLPGAGIRACDTGGMTHAEVAKCLGWPRSTVQQIEARALRKLRLAARRIEEIEPAQFDRLGMVVDLMHAGGWR